MDRTTDVMELIDSLYTMIAEAWGVPLGNEKCIVERDVVLEMLSEIRTRLPAELAEAKQVVSAKEQFINNAMREAESVRKTAEDKARELLNEQEVVRSAKAYATQLIEDAERRSGELRRVASDYVDEILRRAEESLGTALGGVSRTRLSFRSAAGETPAASENDNTDKVTAE